MPGVCNIFDACDIGSYCGALSFSGKWVIMAFILIGAVGMIFTMARKAKVKSDIKVAKMKQNPKLQQLNNNQSAKPATTEKPEDSAEKHKMNSFND